MHAWRQLHSSCMLCKLRLQKPSALPFLMGAMTRPNLAEGHAVACAQGGRGDRHQ